MIWGFKKEKRLVILKNFYEFDFWYIYFVFIEILYKIFIKCVSVYVFCMLWKKI